MKIIPFDIEKAKSGKYKIQTKDGKPVRIICWDRKCKLSGPILSLIETDGVEYTQAYKLNGKMSENIDCPNDLVLVDESKQAIYDDINFILKNIDILIRDGHTPTDLAYDKYTLLIMNSILPKWKRIHKGEKLPERSFVKVNNHLPYCTPSEKGTVVCCDCWYLPIKEIENLDYEI